MLGGFIGGISAYITSDGDINKTFAGFWGGAVSGALFSCGAGIVTAAVKEGLLGTIGTLTSMSFIGASANVAGNVTGQVTEQMLDNPQMNIMDAKIDMYQVKTSALFGAATGFLSGGILLANKAIEASGKAMNSLMGQQMEKTSQVLMQQNAPMQIIQKVQAQYISGMTNVGLSANQIITTTTIIDELGIPFASEFISNRKELLKRFGIK